LKFLIRKILAIKATRAMGFWELQGVDRLSSSMVLKVLDSKFHHPGLEGIEKATQKDNCERNQQIR